MNTYEKRARLTPGFFAMAPIIVLIFTLGLETNPVLSVSIGLIAACGGTYLLSISVANLGRQRQSNLWKSWGGAPTTQLLRINSEQSNMVQRSIWRNAIENVTGVKLLSRSEESSDPTKADELITAAIDQIKSLSHDSRYPLVAKENAQYGLQRNLYGIRWLGRFISLSCLATCVITYIVFQSSSITLIVGVVIEIIISVLWFLIPSESLIRDAGFRYGEQLLQAVTRESSILNKKIKKKGKKS